jgi:hypothetical protein
VRDLEFGRVKEHRMTSTTMADSPAVLQGRMLAVRGNEMPSPMVGSPSVGRERQGRTVPGWMAQRADHNGGSGPH